MPDSCSGGPPARDLARGVPAPVTRAGRPPERIRSTHARFVPGPFRRGRIDAVSSLRRTMNDERSTILVVEDDHQTRRFLVDNLRADGFDTLTASAVDEALATIADRYPDLVLVDLGLPGRDGLELL